MVEKPPYDFDLFRKSWDAVQYCALQGVPYKLTVREAVMAYPYEGETNPAKKCTITYCIRTDGKSVKKRGKVYKRIKVKIIEPYAVFECKPLAIWQSGSTYIRYINSEIRPIHEDPRVYSNRGRSMVYPASFLIEWVE